MAKFNIKEFENDSVFTCDRCSLQVGYRIAANGCPVCGNHLFKVANRSGTPQMWDKDIFDPYARQRQKAIDQGSGMGTKLTTPGDEGFGTGMGTRLRGKDAPRDFSSDSEQYEDDLKDDVPSDHDDLLSNPPGQENHNNWFTTDDDPIGDTQEGYRSIDPDNVDNQPGINQRLQMSRFNNGLRRRLDDSVFGVVSKRQKGAR